MTLRLTPSQTVGPFFSFGLCLDLIGPELVSADDPRAISVRGRLIDGAGDPVPDGMIELWQANAAGRYAHPADTRDIPLEEGFLGFGRTGTAADGSFEFVTVKPGQVPGANGGMQAPHIEVGVFSRGLLKRLATRMYFPGDEANEADPVLSSLDPEARATLVAHEEEGALHFDIRLQGEGQTVFFAI